MFEYDKNYNPNSVDDFVAICCKFIPSQLCFFTPAGNKIKVWNALTGDIKRIYSDISTGEITAFELDNLKKRMIIGDSLGVVAIYNVVNGAKIKTLPKHAAEVTNIVYAIINASKIGGMNKGSNIQDLEPAETRIFITAAMDNKIHMTKDNDFGEN